MKTASHYRRILFPVLLAAMLPLAAQATEPSKGTIEAEISAELASARKEVTRELAAARTELANGNLELRDGVHFGKSRDRSDAKSLPKAEITPRGDFLVAGKEVTIDASQRRELLAYRGQVIDIANAGIDIGERSAQIAIDAVDRGLFSLIFSAMTGSLERRIERTVKEAIEPGLVQICGSLPALLASQQRLSSSLPQFRPYATLEAEDVENCADDMRREFASN